MEGGSFSICCSGLSAARIRLKSSTQLEAWRAVLFNMWLAPQRRRHSSSTFSIVSRLRMVLWHSSRVSGRKGHVDSRC
eukprot:6060726-Pyramimonas_sp.AAC.1